MGRKESGFTVIKQGSHNLSRSRTQLWSLGTGPGTCLLATIYELLQIKEGRHRLSKMGRSLKLRGPSGGEVLASCPSPGHCSTPPSHSSSSFILFARQQGPGTCGWKGSEPGVPSPLWFSLTQIL